MFNTIEKRVPLKSIIAAQIEEAIINKKYLPGSKLPSENELCEQFNVSRTSVREALQILSAHGLITVEKGKGIFVNKVNSQNVVAPLENYLKLSLDSDYVLHLVHARQILEPAIAREASLNHNAKDIEILEADIELLKNSKGGYKELADLDMKFHYDLAKSTGNIVVPLLLKPINNLLPELKSAIYANIDEAKETAVTWHENILNAVKAGDGEQAYAYMVEHLYIAEKHAQEVVKAAKEGSIEKEITE